VRLAGEGVVRVVDGVAVGFVDLLPQAGLAVDLPGDAREGVALFDRVAARAEAAGAALGGGHAVGAADHVGEIGLCAGKTAAAARGRLAAGAALDVGEVGLAVVAHGRALQGTGADDVGTDRVKGASRCGRRARLLPQLAPGHGRGAAGRGPPGVDVQAAAAGVAGFHRQPLRAAAGQQVDEDPLDALLVEAGVFAERDQVAQQAGAVDARAAVGDVDGGPVGLAGDRAVGLEQLAAQDFLGL